MLRAALARVGFAIDRCRALGSCTADWTDAGATFSSSTERLALLDGTLYHADGQTLRAFAPPSPATAAPRRPAPMALLRHAAHHQRPPA